MTENKKPLTYKDAGVNIEAGDRAVDMIRRITQSTFSDNVLTGIGGFGGLYSIKNEAGADPVLVSGTDGVGTKLKIAFLTGKHDTVGIDAVAMCVNDVICTGAKPLFFLDYLATGRLEPGTAKDIVAGVAGGCRQAGCSLIGGEMAEMPGFYADGEYDIAGFCVGIIDRAAIVDGSSIQPGDSIIGIPSSGIHSNGFSLVRKVIFELKSHDVADRPDALEGRTIGDVLLEPTRIYARPVTALAAKGLARGIANITGGGLEANTRRALPPGLDVSIDWTAWTRQPVFDYIAEAGGIEENEMRRVFNCGIGMTVIAAAGDTDAALEALDSEGAPGVVIGKVTDG